MLPAPPAVVDADVLQRCVDYRVRRGWDSALIGAASGGYTLLTGVALFAAGEVREEVMRHLPDIALRRAVDVEAVEGAWRDHVAPKVRFVDLSADSVDDPRLAGVHPKDLPSARLASLLAPSLLLTDNRRHYRPFELAETRTDAVALDLHQLGAVGLGINGSVMVPGAMGVAALRGTRRLATAIGPELSLALGALLAVAAVTLAASERGRAAAAVLREGVRRAGPPLTDALTEAFAAGERVAAFAVAGPDQPTGLSVVARRLANGNTVLTTHEIAALLKSLGFYFDGPGRHETATRAWLLEEPALREVERGRWVLGACSSDERQRR
jgi:hypothetical protein